jgi:hypothetical protein
MYYIDKNKKNLYTRINDAFMKTHYKIETNNGYSITQDSTLTTLYDYSKSMLISTNNNFNDVTDIPYKITKYREYIYEQPPSMENYTQRSNMRQKIKHDNIIKSLI